MQVQLVLEGSKLVEEGDTPAEDTLVEDTLAADNLAVDIPVVEDTGSWDRMVEEVLDNKTNKIKQLLRLQLLRLSAWITNTCVHYLLYS